MREAEHAPLVRAEALRSAEAAAAQAYPFQGSYARFYAEPSRGVSQNVRYQGENIPPRCLLQKG
jgi:hypothetical protein